MNTNKTNSSKGSSAWSSSARAWLRVGAGRGPCLAWGVLRCALGLDFSGVEGAVGAEASVGKSLCAVAEGVGQRIAAFVGYAEGLLVLHEIEGDQTGRVDDGVRLHVSADADVAGLRGVAHLRSSVMVL